MNRQTVTGSSSASRIQWIRDILGEACVNLKLQQLEEIYAYKTGDATSRQEILERWVDSQQNLHLIAEHGDKLACAYESLSVTSRMAHNSPSADGLHTISEDHESENSRRQRLYKLKHPLRRGGRGGYDLSGW